MRKLIPLLVVLALALPAFAQEVAVEASRTAVAAALPTFQQLAKTNFREMGFDSADEITRSTIGTPFAVYMVQLDELGTYKDGEDPNRLLRGRNQVTYPLLLGTVVRSSITVSQTPKGWIASSFGAPSRIRMLTKVRAASVEITRVPESQFFTVEVPGLKLVFLGYRTAEGVLMLVPLFDSPEFNFKAQVPIPAAKAFSTMRVAVKSHMEVPS